MTDLEVKSGARGAKSPGTRILSALELLLGTFIVIGHNVYHMVPNEVPILAALGLISFRVRGGGWSALPFRRPDSWKRLVLIAFAAAAARILLGQFVVEPLAATFWPPIVGPAGMNAIAGHPGAALKWLAIVWTWAAFGEELGYRGYLLTRAADLGGGSAAAYLAGMIFVAVRALLQGTRGGRGLGRRRARPRSRVPLLGPESLGERPRPWLHRYLRGDRSLLRLGELTVPGTTSHAP